MASLDRVLTRLALTEDGNLETVIATLALKLNVTAARGCDATLPAWQRAEFQDLLNQ